MAVSGEEEQSAGASHSRTDPRPNGTHYLAKRVLSGSAILHAVSGHIRSPSSLDVVFGKETSLELASIGDDDGVVRSICDQTVFGIVKDLAVLKWNASVRESTPKTEGKDLLVVLSDSGKLSFLSFCSEMHRFFALNHVQLSPPGNPRFQLGRMLAVDPNGCFIAVSAYDDRFALFPVSKSAGDNIVEEKICYPAEETSNARDTPGTYMRGTIWSICFLGTDYVSNEGYSALLAIIMRRKGNSRNELFLFGCDLRIRFICLISHCSDPGPLLCNISAIPHLSGFALLFRMGDMLLVDLRDPHNICSVHRVNFSSIPCEIEEESLVEEPCRGIDVDEEGIYNVAASALLELRDSGDDMVGDDDPMITDSGSGKVAHTSKYVVSWSWEPVRSTCSKLIICLDTGELHIIEIISDIGVQVNLSECLYNSLPCKMLLWVNAGLIAGLVDMGDGLVLMLEHGKLLYKSPIQNIAPILDISVGDNHDEKQDQMFACCGMAPEGSIRIIKRGISVEELLRTPPIYQGVTGTWTLRMKGSDPYHSFLVLSFVEETRVLSVGLSFIDITDASGFQPDACTLACGLVADGLLVQIHKAEVRLCLPTTCAHPEGISLSEPICTSWRPDKLSISLGAVGQKFIIVATSNPCLLFLLGIRSTSSYHHEIYEIQHVKLQHEVSCISIPRESINHELLASKVKILNKNTQVCLQNKAEIGITFVIGTHKPAVELLSFVPEEGLKVLAIGNISINNAFGIPVNGCIPEDVRLVSVDRFYVLSGLRNGMMLRYEWPAASPVALSEQSRKSHYETSYFSKMSTPSPSAAVTYSFGNLMKADDSKPVYLQLIAIRRIGITPAVLVPVHDLLDADIIVLSDRPWLLHSARHSLAYSSISFQSATHVTPVCSGDCPNGILFVADSSLHLLEMVHTKRLNVHKISVGGTPRKVLYHRESKTLLVMRTGLSGIYSSDICRVDPLSGAMLQKFRCERGETAKCMQIVRVGNKEVLVVGTSLFSGKAIMPSGEAESAKGRLIVLSLESPKCSSDDGMICTSNFSPYISQICSPSGETVGHATEQLSSSRMSSSPDDMTTDVVKVEETETANLRLLFQVQLPGVVLSVCSYLDSYFLASAGNMVNVFGFLNDNPQRLRKFAMAKTRFTVTCLTSLYTRIVVGDCRDGILFYSYHEDLRKLEQLYSDPVQRLVADCALTDMETVVVSDRRGNISVLSCTHHLEGNESPEKNLMLNSSFYLGETVMCIKKGSFSHKQPLDDSNDSDGAGRVFQSACNSIMATTLLGSVVILIPITSKEFELLDTVQDRLVVHPLTCPVLGNDLKEFRGRGTLGGPTMLDGDMLAQFLELTRIQQEAVLAPPPGWLSSRALISASHHAPVPPVSVSEVVRVLERVHYALN
ncbi:splicing factor 3B subunit 3 [Iris pallida]|uniref:Splicing factor 3B subunit 3 n=1 Tax=Iris pallida TaxID=29817 RepID=A0AAX6GFV8_IRIPA|nr:splicing factor 3B subunit 3 [Iris pallida]